MIVVYYDALEISLEHMSFAMVFTIVVFRVG